jgi:CheY-like chemotaxis protein
MAKSVLIVEDDPATQQLLVALMRRDGLAATVAANGGEAIQKLGGTGYDVIILDLMMPSVGGREVIQYLATNARSEKVIVCTAAGPRMTAEVDQSPVVSAVVRKPFDIDELTRAVAAITGS